MPKVQIRLRPVFRDVDLPMLVGVHRPGIDIDVGIEFLNGNAQSPRLQQSPQRCADDPLAQRRRDSPCNEDIFCLHGSPRFTL